MSGLSVQCRAINQNFNDVGTATVKLREITDAEIDWYVASGEPLDKAGSYAIQGRGAIFVEYVEGDPTTVIGLSLPLLWHYLEQVK